MIKTVSDFIKIIQSDSKPWGEDVKPWFRGESGSDAALLPKIAKHPFNHENYVLQTFRRQAGGLANVPNRDDTDLWLFLAQHYGVPTRLLDWTEGALHALYFALNKGNENTRVYMLNPRKLNTYAGVKTHPLNFPLTWGTVKPNMLTLPAFYVALAWGNRGTEVDIQVPAGFSIDIPVAIPATYQDQRMIAQRSCFTIHGNKLEPMMDLLSAEQADCLIEYKIDSGNRVDILRSLSVLGISASTIFPDLDHLALDLNTEIENNLED